MVNNRVFGQSRAIHRGAVDQSAWLDELLSILGKIVDDMPPSSERRAHNALGRARELVIGASLRAAAISAELALEPEPSEWSTFIRDLSAIWRLQARMVKDIGAVFGQNGKLMEASIIYCLSRQAAAQFVCKLLTDMEKPARCSSRSIDNESEKAGCEITQRVARPGRRGWLPLIGAAAVAAYAYSDTRRVGRTAIEFFTMEIEPG
jgi:hypothetical protein